MDKVVYPGRLVVGMSLTVTMLNSPKGIIELRDSEGHTYELFTERTVIARASRPSKKSRGNAWAKQQREQEGQA